MLRSIASWPRTRRRDPAALASLVRDARAERARGTPPHRYRELFRTLRALVANADQAAPTDDA